MVKNRQKKTCSKAKREKEILHDLDVLARRGKIVEVACETEQDPVRLGRYQREYQGLKAATDRLHEELRLLWTANPKKKK